MRLSSLAAFLAIAGALVFVAPASAATNLAPNPGFEEGSSCDPGPPCAWTLTGSGPSVTRDTTSFHDGVASMRLADGTVAAVVRSDCILALSAGLYNAAIWYRADVLPDFLTLTLVPFTGATCDGDQLPGSGLSAGGFTGSWQQASSSVTAPDGTQSAKLEITVGCLFVCESYDAFLDDVELVPAAATAVTVSLLTGSRTNSGVRLRWRTSSETETLGFNVYRQRNGKRVKLNRVLIPSVFGGSAKGRTYSWVDRSAPTGAVTYRLQAVSLSGTRSWVGSVVAG